MSSYDSPDAGHRNALAQLSEDRKRCMEFFSAIRENTPNTFHTHLVAQPASASEQTLVKTNQAVAQYLLQLHPYRTDSERWEIDLGSVRIPEHVPGIRSKRRSASTAPRLRICRMPSVRLTSLSDVIAAINMTVTYSQNFSPESAVTAPRGTEVRVGGRSVHVGDETLEAWLAGDVSDAELIERGRLAAEESRSEDTFEPARPAGDGQQSRSFKFVFPSDMLLGLVEHADEIAAEMDMLADIEDKTGRDTEGL